MPQVDNLRDLFFEIVNNYQKTRSEPLKDHPLANLIRRKPRELLEGILNNPDLKIKGSHGMGVWTPCPWIGVFNKYETDGAQEGIYVVYIFSEES